MPTITSQAVATFRSLDALGKDQEKRKLLVADKGLRKDLFEIVGMMDDLRRELFKSEEISRQFLEEFKKKRDVKKH